MKKSEQLARELESAKAQYKKDIGELYKMTPHPTHEQYKPIHELCDKIDSLEFEVTKERRREIEVGDGCTLCLYTDRHAYTVVRKTNKTIVIQRDKVVKDPSFKPDWVIGGFSAVCINQDEQKYIYEQDLGGRTIRAYWNESKGCYMHQGCKVINGRHEFYDYNF